MERQVHLMRTYAVHGPNILKLYIPTYDTSIASADHVNLVTNDVRNIRNLKKTNNELIKGSVYSYNNFQQIVVRIAVNLILTTNNITDYIMRNE